MTVLLVLIKFDPVSDDGIDEGHEATLGLPQLFTTHYNININYKICGVHY